MFEPSFATLALARAVRPAMAHLNPWLHCSLSDFALPYFARCPFGLCGFCPILPDFHVADFARFCQILPDFA